MGNENQSPESEAADEMATFIGEAGKDGAIIPPAKVDKAEADDAGAADDAAGGAESEAAGADADADAVGEEAADKVGEEETPAEEKKPKKKQSPAERIAHYRYVAGEAERQRDALKAENETLRKGTAPKEGLTEKPAAATSAKAPDPADPKYKFGEVDPAYLADTTKFHVTKALAEAEAEKETAREVTAAAEKQKSDMTAVGKVIEAGRGEFEDFDEVVLTSPIIAKELPPALHELLLGHEDQKMSAKIAHHLATNPEEARKVFGKGPLAQAAYFGRLEAKFSAKAATPPKTPKAPDPPKDKARGAGGKFATTSDTTDFEAFEKLAERSQRD